MSPASAEPAAPASVTRATFSLPASLQCRHLAIDFVKALVAHVSNATSSFRDEMVTAFGEAFNNIVIHGYRDRSDGMVSVEAELSSEQVTLRLCDTGCFVDFDTLSPPDLDSMPEGGLGVFMIYSLVDEVVYQRGAPNILSLTKKTAGARPDDG